MVRRLALILTACVTVAAGILPAQAETVQWASHATASSSYGEASPENRVLGLAFYLAGPLGNGFSVVEPALAPTLEVLLCSVFGGTPCVPEDPAEFAGDTANGASEIPNRAPGFVTGLPGSLEAMLTGLPGAIETVVRGGPWGSGQATGAPNTYPSCGDIGTAWAPQSNGVGPENITLYYAPPVAAAKRIDIYETNIGGFVTSVEITLADGSTQTVFNGPDTTGCPGILSINLTGDPTVVAVKVNTQAAGWEEIDAVGVIS